MENQNTLIAVEEFHGKFKINESYRPIAKALDVEDWANMVEKLGINWASTKASIPNILRVVK